MSEESQQTLQLLVSDHVVATGSVSLYADPLQARLHDIKVRQLEYETLLDIMPEQPMCGYSSADATDQKAPDEPIVTTLDNFLAAPSDAVRGLVVIDPSPIDQPSAIMSYIERILWKRLNLDEFGVTEQFVPIVVEFKEVSLFMQAGSSLYQSALSRLQSNLNVDNPILLRNHKLVPVWLFDGYEELKQAVPICRDLYQCGITIVACRESFAIDTLNRRPAAYFVPRDDKNPTYSYAERFLRVPDNTQVENYVRLWSSQEGKEITHSYKSDQIMDVIKRSPGLRECSNNLFMLKQIIPHIPIWAERDALMKELLERNLGEISKLHTLRLSTSDILRDIFTNHVRKSRDQFVSHPTWPSGFEAEFMEQCQRFCEDLAYCILKHGNMECYSIDTRNPTFLDLLGQDSTTSCRTRFFMQAIPVYKTGSTNLAFVHRSFFEYFVACRSLRLPQETLEVRLFTQELGMLHKHAEALEIAGSEMQTTYVNIVLKSRERHQDPSQDQRRTVAASNAISVLNYASATRMIPFSFRNLYDWSSIRVPEANLNFAQLIGCNFIGACLSNATMVQAVTRNSSFRSADLRGVYTGQFPVLYGHSASIWSMCFSPDGQWIATASPSAIRIWNVASRKCTGILKSRTNIGCITFSPDGRTILVGSERGMIRAWDFESQKMVKSSFSQHSNTLRSICQSPDGRYIATSSSHDFIGISDGTSLTRMSMLKGHKKTIPCICFSPDSSKLISCSQDHFIRIWNPATSQCIRVLEEHTGPIESVCFSRNGQFLVSAGNDGIRLWDTTTYDCLTVLVSPETQGIRRACISADNRWIIGACGDNTLSAWDLKTFERSKRYIGHNETLLAIGCSPVDPYVASVSMDRTLRCWDLSRSHCVATIPGHTNAVTRIRYHPQGHLVASCSRDRTIRIWDTTLFRCQAILDDHTDQVHDICFSHDGQMLASASADKSIRLWDTQTWQCKATITGHTGAVSAIRFSPDSRYLISGSYNWELRVWDVAEMQCIRKETSGNWILEIMYSPNGEYLVVGSNYESGYTWNSKTWQHLSYLEGHRRGIPSIDFSPDGKLLATASWDNEIRIWNPETAECTLTLLGHKDSAHGVRFTPNGQYLVSCAADQTVKIWSPSTGECLVTLEATAKVNCVAISPDGQTIIAGCQDKSLRIWDIELALRPSPTKSSLCHVVGSSHALDLSGDFEDAQLDPDLAGVIYPNRTIEETDDPPKPQGCCTIG